MKKIIADALIVLLVLLIIGSGNQATKAHQPGDVAGALGALTGFLLLLVGLFYSVRWRLKLSGRTHKVGRQALATILLWYSLFAALIGLAATFERSFTFGPGMIVIWSCSAYFCYRWLRRLRGDRTISPAGGVTPLEKP